MRTVVAATKLAIPRSHPRSVARPALMARLDGGHRCTLVSAPAGYGKTATLAAWAAAQPDEVVWLSCDRMDAEPTRFMSSLLAAISKRWPGVADDAFVLLGRDGANTYDPAVAVANELASMEGRGMIVVDDLHLAAPAPTMLTAFIEALPEQFRFVVGTRSDPPLSLARWRLRDELLELRGDDLRFLPEELREFFELHDIELDVADVEQLHELTEGWPAGAQMAAIAMQRGVRGGDLVDALASTDRAVGDFLLSEVLANLPLDLVDFLVATSVLEAFDAALCAEVTGVEDAALVLERLINANLFIVELDDPPGWYRYHHLFGAFLRARLASLGRSRSRAAHDQASHALEARGQVDAALRHAMSIGDLDRASQILRRALTQSMSMSGAAVEAVRAVRLWLHERGTACLETDPAWLLELLIGLISIARPDDAPAWLERVRDANPQADGPLIGLIEGAWAVHLENHGQPLESIRRLGRAMDAVGGKPLNVGPLALIYVTMARTHIQSGQLDEARRIVRHAHAHPVGHPVADNVRIRGVAAFVAASDGELTAAASIARAVGEAADELGLEHHELGRIYAGLAMVEICRERNELENARDMVEGMRAAAEVSHRVTVQSDVILQHARVLRSLGDETGSAALLMQARLCYPVADAGMRQLFDEEAVHQALRFDPARARALTDGLDPDRVATQVLRARVALLDHDDVDAAQLLAVLPPASSRRTRVERAVLCAQSLLDRDMEQANSQLTEAMDIGQPEWLIRTVIELSPEVHKLLVSFPPTACQQAYVDALLAAAGRGVAPSRAPTVMAMVDPLTPRELTVLRYLCSRLTYSEIAAALYVSPNTLKSHVRTVYRKIGATSRADAVEGGRSLRLI